MSGGLIALWGIVMHSNVTEEAQGIRLVATLLARTGERERTLGKNVCLLQAARQQLRLPQGAMTERLRAYHVHDSSPFHGLREQRHGVGDAPG